MQPSSCKTLLDSNTVIKPVLHHFCGDGTTTEPALGQVYALAITCHKHLPVGILHHILQVSTTYRIGQESLLRLTEMLWCCVGWWGTSRGKYQPWKWVTLSLVSVSICCPRVFLQFHKPRIWSEGQALEAGLLLCREMEGSACVGKLVTAWDPVCYISHAQCLCVRQT